MILLRASLWLAVLAGLFQLLRRVRPISARWERVAWGAVLVQGLMLSPWVLELPWLAPLPPDSLAGEVVLPPPQANSAATFPAPPASVPTLPAAAHPPLDWQSAWGWIWVTGISGWIGWLLISYAALLYEVRRTETAETLWQAELDEALTARGLSGARIQLRLSTSLGPFLCRTPTRWLIIVPAALWAKMTRAQRLAVLAHELIHYQRQDVLQSFVAQCLVLIHWFNPAAWWARSQFDQAAEWACDEQLNRESPESATHLAAALLAAAESGQSARRGIPGIVAANGAPLRTRMKRLLQSPPQETIMKRWIIWTLLLATVAAGAIRVQLVAQDQPAPVNEQFAGHVAQLAEALPDAGSLGALKAALATEEGRLVLRGRTESYVQTAREAAQANAIPDYIQQHYDRDKDGKLTPKSEEYVQQLQSQVEQFQADVARTRVALETIAAQLDGDDEHTEFLRRFLKNEGPTMLYLVELRKRMRPTREVLEYHLRQLLVRDSSGHYRLREDHRAEAQRMADNMLPLLEQRAVIHETLSTWADDLAETDPLHQDAKQALQSESFALYIAARAAEKSTGGVKSPRGTANRIADQLDEATEATLKGLVFRKEALPKLKELLDGYRALKQNATAARPLLAQLAEKIAPEDELHAAWSKLLKSELGAMKIGEALGKTTVGESEQDLRAVILEVIGKAFEERGERFVLRKEVQDKVIGQLQEVIRQHRRVLRHGRGLDDAAADVVDASLRATLETEAAKFIVAHQVADRLKRSEADGLQKWMADHLQQDGDGNWQPTAAGDKEITSILTEVANVRKQLEKDDF